MMKKIITAFLLLFALAVASVPMWTAIYQPVAAQENPPSYLQVPYSRYKHQTTAPSQTKAGYNLFYGKSTGFFYKSGTGSEVTIYDSSNGVAAAGGFTSSSRLIHTGGIPAQVSTDGTDATPVATEVYFAEVFIPANVTVTGVAVFNGSVASGNLKVGLADSTGAVVATSASTAMSGTDAYQRIAFTSTYAAKGPATYYVLEFVDNDTARINTHTLGNFVAGKQTGQVYATGFTTITPGSTFTTALGPIASLY